MEEVELESVIQWCCQKRYYNDMLSHARQALDVYPTNERLRALMALALTFNNHNKDALKEATSLESNEYSEAALSALLIQSYIHKKLETQDRVLVAQVDTKIREDRASASPTALSLAAVVLLLLGKLDKAREYADRAYKMSPSDANVILAKGWCCVDSGENPAGYFETVLAENSKHFNALLGSARSREARGDHTAAILILNPLIVRYPKLSLPLVEKMQNLLALREWDQTLDTVGRILSFDGSSIDALQTRAIVAICKSGDYGEAVKHVQTFFRNLVVAEPKNVELFVGKVQLFARIAVKNQPILGELFKVTDKMSQHNPGISAIMAELGNVCALMGKHKDAEHWYRAAVRLDESSFVALRGLANCQMNDASPSAGHLAKRQIDFLLEMQSTSPELLYMSAKLASGQPTKAVEMLNRAAEMLIESCNGLYYGSEYLRSLNPDLSMDVLNEYLLHSSIDTSSRDAGGSSGAACLALLERLTEACPGLSSALLLMGRVKMQTGDLNGALMALKKLLDTIDRTNPTAHLLMARILVKQGHYENANQTLEIGLSYNFKVRDDPLYHMIVGSIAKENGDLEGAIKSFETAMSSAGLRPDQDSKSSVTPPAPLSTADKTTLYLELISACARLRKFNEATILMEDASEQLAGTPEQGRCVIGHAELCLEMDEVNRAVELLRGIAPGQPYYLQAHTKLADVYLKRRKDRHSFAKCYRDLVENCPGPETYGMLGDAYLSIQEPERAIEAYEYSLQSSPGDKALVRKMGRALVRTHQYAKAISFYREAVQRDGCRELRLDMAELFMKLKQFDKAEEVLLQELNEGRGATDITTLETRGKQLLLLAKVRERSGNLKGALTTLKEAKENQVRYVQRATMLPNLLDQKAVLAEICFGMAEHASSLRDFGQAVEHYKEALTYKPNDVKALLSLAKLYMQMNELDTCTQCCQILLNTDPNNEAACVMMADLAFRKVDFDTAAFHFRQLLLQKPTYWTALARLIEVSRRTGNIDDLSEWLSRAENAMDPTKPEAGFHYCSGLLDWRTGKLNTALRSFNAARRDPEWGQQAIYNMIEICLDPDDDSALSSEIFNDDEGDSQDSRSMALKTAQRLLQELNPKGNPHELLTHRLLGNFFLLATKQKHNIERALHDCTQLASQESLRDHVGPALGLAMAHILLKQTPRARNHLKRVSKNTWTFEDAEYLERCWLLLADIYFQSSKYDLAGELLKRVLQHNATCVRAHELSGCIAEKEQSYRDAAVKYALAWKYGGKNKLSVGYKLAYCCLKSKQYAEAIEAGNEVLKLNPDYPRIKKDILEKSVNNLRS